MIRAIETTYRGYKFRSRLEARWAVFFDALGVDWDYEPEGFELPNGERYRLACGTPAADPRRDANPPQRADGAVRQLVRVAV